MAKARIFWSPLACVLIFGWLTTYSHAVPIAEAQRTILYRIRSEQPLLGSIDFRPWTNQAIDDGCEPSTLYGVEQCNSEGWITRLHLSSAISLGSIPSSIGDMEELTYFYSSRTWSGAFPESIGNLSKLTRLEFDNNPFLGSAIPEGWKGLISLQEFGWTYTENGPFEIPGWIGEEWPNLKKFKWNLLGSVQPLPPWIGTLPLTHLEVKVNQMTGVIPAGLASNPTLESLDLRSNRFSSIPLDWSGATRLAEMFINSNQLSNLPTTLPPSLLTLDAHSNEASVAIPQSYFDHPTLKKLFLASVGLIGELPWPTEPHKSALTDLDLHGNPLGGSLPSSFFHLPELKACDIRDTNVIGPLPDNITPECAFQQLVLSFSPIGGPLPARLDFCADLYDLELDHCNLTGTLPESITNMTKLEYLVLSENHLEGPLPNDWSKNTALIYLFMDHNDLSGPVPASIIKLTDFSLQDLQLAVNNFNICADPLITNESIPSEFFTCNVREQNPPSCGCPGIWTHCLIQDMPATCGLSNEPESIPTSEPEIFIPFEPSSPPSNSPSPITGDTPTSSATSSHALLAWLSSRFSALLALLFTIAALLVADL